MSIELDTLCKSCKYGMVLQTVEGVAETDVVTFCSYLETPIKFMGEKKIVDCTQYVDIDGGTSDE